jgi:hypothetical protein
MPCVLVKIISAPCLMATLFAVNVRAHPLSHICPTESRECDPIHVVYGLVWLSGKEGISKVEVCVDTMNAPFDRRTSKGGCASCVFLK